MGLGKRLALASLLIGSTLLSFLFVEALARRVFPMPEPRAKLWLLSSPTFELDPNGAVRYLPNQTIRTAVVWGDSVIYDVRFRTNDFGFVDHEDYGTGDRESTGRSSYAFVGDSFTAGFHAGRPWVPELRDRARRGDDRLQIYNLGVSGSGFEQFVRIAESASTQLSFSEIVVLAISDDFWRPFWRPIVTGDALRFCETGRSVSECPDAPQVATIIDPDLGQEEALTLARRLEEEAAADPPPRKLRQRLVESSRLAALMYERYRRFKLARSDELQQSLARLADLRERFPEKRIHFVHLPTVGELAKASYDLDVEDRIRELGIGYFPALTGCDWPEGNLFFAEGHPNATGYGVISSCLSKHFDLGS